MPQHSIRLLESARELEVCARFMAESDPSKLLGRGIESCLEALSDASRERWGAWSGGEIAGFLILNLRGPLTGYIQAICVAPAFRGSGVGSALLAHAES